MSCHVNFGRVLQPRVCPETAAARSASPKNCFAACIREMGYRKAYRKPSWLPVICSLDLGFELELVVLDCVVARHRVFFGAHEAALRQHVSSSISGKVPTLGF